MGRMKNTLPSDFSDYLSVRNWDKDKLLAGEWHLAHPDNMGKSMEEYMPSCLSVIQSWLTLGFPENIFD